MSIIEVIADYCESNELEFRTDYSGRGMFGKTCVGVVCDDPISTVVEIADAIRDNGFDCASTELGAIRQDSMGLSRIIYFPNLCKEV